MGMQTLFIVTPKEDSPGVRSLLHAASNLDIDARVLLLEDEDISDSLGSAETVVYRFGPKSYDSCEKLATLLEGTTQGTVLKNNLQAFDKCISYQRLADLNVPMPSSVIITSNSESSAVPVVIKPPVGNQGGGVQLIQTTSDFKRERLKYLQSYGQFLAQEYIPESQGSDKRLVVVGGTVIAAMKRTAAEGDFRANLHRGGTAVTYEPTAVEVTLAIKACEVLGIQLAGVDIIDSHRGPLVLEVNPSPGFGISEVVGFDVAHQVIKILLKEKKE